MSRKAAKIAKDKERGLGVLWRENIEMAFFEGFRDVSGKSYPPLGLGENVRFQDNSFSGAVLVHEGKVLHLSAFLGQVSLTENCSLRFLCSLW